MGSIHNFYKATSTSNIHEFYGMGYNYRMTEFQAAIGGEQLKKLDRMVETRRRNASYLTKRLQEIKGVSPSREAPWAKHAFYYYSLRIDTGALGVTREQFEKALNAEGIPVSPAWSTTFLPKTQLFAKKIGYGRTDYPWCLSSIDYTRLRLPVAEGAGREAFWLTDALPILSQKDLDDIIAAVEKVSSAFLARGP